MITYSDVYRNLEEIHKRVRDYRRAFFIIPDPWMKTQYEQMILNEIYRLDILLKKLETQILSISDQEQQDQGQREFTLEELAKYDGLGGRPAYVAVNGKVYDVSLEATWGGASHFGLLAGKDLTSQFQGCHGNEAILSRLPVVGVLKE